MRAAATANMYLYPLTEGKMLLFRVQLDDKMLGYLVVNIISFGKSDYLACKSISVHVKPCRNNSLCICFNDFLDSYRISALFSY